jgi:hypothetical protein
MSDDDRIDSLLNTQGENQPAQLRTQGATGPRDIVEPEEQAARRLLLQQVLIAGEPSDAIYAAFAKKFHMTKDAVDKLELEVYSRWEVEDTKRGRYLKEAARRRILGHIKQAADHKSWNAVMIGEKILAGIEGTNAPLEVHATTDVQFTARILSFVSEMTEEELGELIQDERRRALEGDVEPEIPIDVTPVDPLD